MDYNLLQTFELDKYMPLANWGKSASPVAFSYVRQLSGTDPTWWVSGAKLANNPIGRYFVNDMNAAAGTSIFIKETLLRTLGETLERYSSTNSHLTDKAYLRPVDESKGFVRCHDLENSPVSFKANGLKGNVEHTEVIKLADNSLDYLPSEHVHLGYMRVSTGIMHTSPISTGCAFFPDEVTAIWKGLCEVVERDAMMRTWYLRQKPLKLNLNSIIDFDICERLKRIKDKGLKLHVFEISSVIEIPVFYAILESDRFPYYCVGAAADANPIRAIIKSIDEVVSIRIMANWNGYKKEEELNLESFEWVNRLHKHMELYANWSDTPAFDFLFDEKVEIVDLPTLVKRKRWITPPSTYADLMLIAQELSKKGFDTYWKDLTIEEVKEFGHVVKVVIPQMVPLSQAFQCRWLASLFENQDLSNVNPFPHPFS